MTSYLDSLPSSFDTVPLLWKAEDAKRLPASTRVYLAKQKVVFRKHHGLAQAYIRSHEKLGPLLHGFTEEEFLWAWLVVNSRCIYQELSPQSTRDDNYACAPLIDMINHVPSSVPHCKLSYDIKGLSVISQNSYEMGDEVYISYGAHSNEALLCEYGFVLHNNSDNSLNFDHQLSKVLRSWHLRLLMELGYYEDCTINGDGEISFRTEVAIRVSLLSEADCEEGTDGCRRLTQYVNGRIDGQAEDAEVDRTLCRMVLNELKVIEAALVDLDEVCERESATLRPLQRQIWRDHFGILKRCLRRHDKYKRHRHW